MGNLKSLGEILTRDFTEEAVANQPDRIKTGFPQLDRLLGGGLSPGLIVLGGVPGLGKSTLALQIACRVAAQSIPVLYFSLEMSPLFLGAKTISRKVFESLPDGTREQLLTMGVTAGQLTSGAGGRSLTPAQWKRIHQARSQRKDVEQLYVISESLSAADIRERVDRFLKETPGVKPVVIVDYLQILASGDPRGRNERQIVDDHLKYMTDMARNGLVVLLISSLSRSGYQGSVRMDSFKETGGIEYSADVLLGLQFFTDDPGGREEKSRGAEKLDLSAEKKRFPRNVELVVLKQRYGGSGEGVRFRYYAEFDCFQELGSAASRTDPPLPTEAPPARRPAQPVYYMNNTKLAGEIRNGRYAPGELRACRVFRDGSAETSYALSEVLSRLDCQTLDAVYTIFKNGRKDFTAGEVLRILSGSASQNAKKEREIEGALDRLMGTEISIHCTEEMRKRKKAGGDEEIVLSGACLSARREKNRYHFLSADIAGALPLYAYAELTRQMIAFPARLLDVQTGKGRLTNTTENIFIKRFLIRRLEVLRNRNNQSTGNMRVISLQDSGELLSEIGMNEREYESKTARRQKQRNIRQTVLGILQYYRQIGYIQDYEDDGASVKILGEIRDPWSLESVAGTLEISENLDELDEEG